MFSFPNEIIKIVWIEFHNVGCAHARYERCQEKRRKREEHGWWRNKEEWEIVWPTLLTCLMRSVIVTCLSFAFTSNTKPNNFFSYNCISKTTLHLCNNQPMQVLNQIITASSGAFYETARAAARHNTINKLVPDIATYIP